VRKRTGSIIYFAILTAAELAFSQAPTPTVRAGAYTAAQATAGETAYRADCASCHGADLEGRGQTPPLVGNEFIAEWRDMSVGLLFEKIQSSMPADKPGSLSQERNAQILAFMLKRNGFPAGPTPLSADPDALKKVQWGAK